MRFTPIFEAMFGRAARKAAGIQPDAGDAKNPTASQETFPFVPVGDDLVNFAKECASNEMGRLYPGHRFMQKM